MEGVDRAALKDPARCSKFKCALRAIKPPPWAMPVDEHERFAAGAVCKAAKVAFGAPARRPRRGHVVCAAWALICDRRTVKTWCRERRVSTARRGIVPGRAPDPLCVFMWASGRGSSDSLARHVFSELAAQVAPLIEGAGPQDELWEFLRVFLRHSGGVPKGHLKAASAAFLEATACELDVAQADRAHDLAWRKLRSLTCRGGAKWKGAKSLPGRVGEDGVAATTTQEVSGSSGTSLPSKLRKSVLSKPMPTDTVALGPLSRTVPCAISVMCVIWSRSGGCLPGRSVQGLRH